MNRPIRRALLSVSDKTGLVEFAGALAGTGVEIISTGGTGRALAEAGIPAVDVTSVTGFPEILGGRGKTLHPLIHGGVLADRSNPVHAAEQAAHVIADIDLVAVNLYPFEEALARRAHDSEMIEMIDIGGPALLRAAAKNHASVTVIVDPADYMPVIAEIDSNSGATHQETRRRLAAKAFARTAPYDSAVADWLLREDGVEEPVLRAVCGTPEQALRY